MKVLLSENVNDENSLTLQLKEGSIKAFEFFFNQYKKSLYLYALKYLHSSVEAEEVIQNTFLALWESRKSLNEALSVKNYLFKTTINNVYNHLKHEAVRQKYIEYALSNQMEEDNDLQENIIYNDLKKNIFNLIEQLPEQQQKIFKKSRWEGISYDEIAKEMGLSVRTVENQIYRALKFIKENLRNISFLLIVIISFNLFVKVFQLSKFFNKKSISYVSTL